jgi:hypothetical protein
MAVSMSIYDVEELQTAIEAQHGKPVGQGVVHVFDPSGHPKKLTAPMLGPHLSKEALSVLAVLQVGSDQDIGGCRKSGL